MTRHISSTRLIRTYNASKVLQTLYKHGSCSRSQLTKFTGMSPATITRIVADLMEQGVVLEGRVGKSTGGRRPVYIHIDHSKLYIASVKLLQDDCVVALMDLKGRILRRKSICPTVLKPEWLLAEVISSLNDLLDEHPINSEHLIGVGVAISGVCHPQKGIVVNSVNLGWKNVAVADTLHNALQLPIFIENDANASALAELWFGHAKDTINSMYIKTETGAGVGIILNRTLLSGPNFMTGEIGHVPLIPEGHLCRCGQRGCLEPYVYMGDIKARYLHETGIKIKKEQFTQLVQAKDVAALRIVQESAPVLALACAHWGILLDIDVITIGGLWGKLDEDVINCCQSYYQHVLERTGITREVTITGSSFGDDTDLLGAAGLVIDHWLMPDTASLDR